MSTKEEINKFKSEIRKLKISDLIEQLEGIKKEHGDVPVNVFDPDEMEQSCFAATPAYIALEADAKDKVIGVTICDYESAMAFLE